MEKTNPTPYLFQNKIGAVLSMNIEGTSKSVNQIPCMAGIYQVTNHASGSKFVNISSNLPVTFKRLNFLLSIGAYDNRELQKEFNKYGESNFDFEILDYIQLEEDTDFTEKRAELLDDWQTQHAVEVNGR